MLLYFSLTLFASATLLFLVQPMIGKMILPRLGGTPAVWNTCMVFFQGVLLIGYGYTHFVSTYLGRRQQLVLQIALLIFPFLVLPYSLGNWAPPTEENPIFNVFWLLLGMVGLPFFVVSTSAPLLQKWFATTGHPASKDPYFLYGASNFGSLLALMAYPSVVEPSLPVDGQSQMWTYGYAVLAIFVAGCALLVARSPEMNYEPAPEPTPAPAPAPEVASAEGKPRRFRLQETGGGTLPTQPKPASAFEPDDLITWPRRLRWIGLAAAPSSLMLGTTTFLTTDIAAIPSFWVLPLGLYLITFILAFARWPVVWTRTPHTVVLYLQPCFLLLLLVKMLTLVAVPTVVEFSLHISSFFLTTLMCHGELAKDRPSAKKLTEFYLWLSVGGVVGGLFNALIAPMFFYVGIIEYPIAMAFACLLRPNMTEADMNDSTSVKPMIPGDSMASRATSLGYVLDVAAPILFGIAAYCLTFWGENKWLLERRYNITFLLIAVLAMSLRPLRFGLSVAAVIFAVMVYDRGFENLIFEGRGFFGPVRVREYHADEGRIYRTLIHGGINHGQQIYEPASERRSPITYFHPTNGIGEVFEFLGKSDFRLPTSIVGLGPDPWSQLVNLHSEPAYAVLGLGTGTLAVHAKAYQHVDFYEIDPMVKRLSWPDKASDPPVFTFVHDARLRHANIDIILGDGRLKIQEAPDKFYHIISLDAFSSDAIPVHLLTAEAVDLYLSKLTEGGILVFNATNRYVEIQPVLAAIALDRNLECLTCPDYGDAKIPEKYGADWVVLRRKTPNGFTNGGPPLRERLDKGREPGKRRWEDVQPLEGRIWTDSYSNLLSIMKWMR